VNETVSLFGVECRRKEAIEQQLLEKRDSISPSGQKATSKSGKNSSDGVADVKTNNDRVNSHGGLSSRNSVLHHPALNSPC